MRLTAVLFVLAALLPPWPGGRAADAPAPARPPPLPGGEAEVRALVQDLEAGGAGGPEWDALVAKHGERALAVVVDLGRDPKYERGVERGLQAVLSALPPGRIVRHLAGLPLAERDAGRHLIEMHNSRNAVATRNQLLILYGLGGDRQALAACRKLWLQLPDPLAMEIAALAVRGLTDGGPGAAAPLDLWSGAGAQILAQSVLSPNRHCLMVAFYVALSNRVGRPNLTPTFLKLAPLVRADAAPVRVLADQLLAARRWPELAALLASQTDPALRLIREYAAAQAAGRPLAPETVETLARDATTKTDLLDLARLIADWAPDQAAAGYARVLARAPAELLPDTEAVLALVRAATAVAAYAQAADHLDRCLAALPADGATDPLRQQLQADAKRLRARAATVSPEYERLLTAGVAARRRGEWPAAEAACRQAVALKPAVPAAYLELLALPTVRADAASARALTAALLKLPPQTAAENLRWAEAGAAYGVPEPALAAADAAVAGNADAPQPYLVRADLHRQLGRAAAALADCDAAAARGGDADRVRGLVHATAGAWAAAEAALADHLLLAPSDLRARLWLFLVRGRQGRDDATALDRDLRRLDLPPGAWERQVAEFCRGRLDAAGLTRAAGASRPAEAQFWIAALALARQQPDQARPALAHAVAPAAGDPFVEQAWARAELARLPPPP